MKVNHRKRKRAPKRARPRTLAAAQPVGTCKRVRGKGKNSCTIELCKTGKGLTGWEFQKDSRRCAGRKS